MTTTPSNFNALNPTLAQAAENHFNGAAIIDEFGNETPITESMVLHACNALTDSWKFPSVNQKDHTSIARAL